jgi:hypothetical protein
MGLAVEQRDRGKLTASRPLENRLKVYPRVQFWIWKVAVLQDSSFRQGDS